MLKDVIENEGVVQKVFDLRDLIVIKAIFNRKGIEPEQLNESREFFPCWTIAVQPGKTTIPCGCCKAITAVSSRFGGPLVQM